MKHKVLVTGGTGLVGRHLQEIMPDATYISSKEYNLLNYDEAETLFTHNPWDTVVHLAARVGGIQANIDSPIGFYEDNIIINTNLVMAAQRGGVKTLIAMLSTCIYPDKNYVTAIDDPVTYPMTEYMLELGPPAESNYGYGIAKRAMYSHIKLCREKLGLNYSCLIPCNLYGEHDNFDLQTCHYVPALLKRIINAKQQGLKKIVLWGTGEPLRQFMYAGDLAKFIKICVSHEICMDLNVATPENKSIKEIAEIALKACDAEHLEIEWDTSKPDGQFRKDVSARELENVFPSMEYALLELGLKQVYEHLMETE